MEKLKKIISQMGFTTQKGIGSEFEIFVYDTLGNSITCVCIGDKFSAVSNRDVENYTNPEYFEADTSDEKSASDAIRHAMDKDRKLGQINSSGKELRTMTCGNCKYCEQMDVCGCDCKCNAKSTDEITFEVSQDDEITFYGEQNNEPCENFTPAG